jgi:crossover junction endodeoxyribonuclease RuvC
MSTILGIDPGIGGALALYDSESRGLELYRMPVTKSTRGGSTKSEIDGYQLGMLIDSLKHRINRAVVEQVSGRPGQAGQFQFGLNCGVVHGVIYSNLIPMQLVASNKWKAAVGLRRLVTQTKADMKSDARRLATMKFPQHAKEFLRVKDDGVAEAALIALYGSTLVF